MAKDGNVTQLHSAGGIVINNGQILVLKWTDRNFVCLPKGGIQASESSENAAIREVKEETGYDTSIVEFINSWGYSFVENGKSYHKVVDYYLMKLRNTNNPLPAREAEEFFTAQWLSIDDALQSFTYEDARQATLMAIKVTTSQ